MLWDDIVIVYNHIGRCELSGAPPTMSLIGQSLSMYNQGNNHYIQISHSNRTRQLQLKFVQADFLS